MEYRAFVRAFIPIRIFVKSFGHGVILKLGPNGFILIKKCQNIRFSHFWRGRIGEMFSDFNVGVSVYS